MNGTNVEPCLLADACKGGRGIVLSESTLTENKSEGDRYCEAGYEGPYCAVCAKNFRPLSGYECLDCQSEWGVAAHAAFGIGMALMPVILVCLILFLLGGTTPFKQASGISFLCFVFLVFAGSVVRTMFYWVGDAFHFCLSISYLLHHAVCNVVSHFHVSYVL